MDKNKIKKFAIDARKKLIATVTDQAGMLGITEKEISSPINKGADFEVYLTSAGTEVTLNRKQCEQRRKLADQINARGFEPVMEEVAYTWFNRLCAIRFMEVNDYMYPARVRVLSSEKKSTISGLVKNEPDIVTLAPDIDWDFTDAEREAIIEAKMNNRLDDLFKMLFIKQCNLLHEVLPGLFEETEDYTEMLLSISFTNEDDVVRMLIDGVDEQDFDVNTIGEDGKPTGQVEIIGWLYQYYNTELKDDTFAQLKKNVKITKERIPAATQLFTPDWIVRYMVENSVGRIWIEHLRALDADVNEKQTAEKFGWKYYLPEAEQEESVNLQLAEIRKDYKDLQPTDIKCIDPCMGSGHILIAMFDVLMDIYKSAGYSERDAAFEIVEHNIHGLDIDKRAYQLAYFAVMMKGRGYNRRFFRGRDEEKPVPKVYAIVESNEINKNHLQFFGKSLGESERNKANKQMEYLLHTFVDAREYGSILNVEECDWELQEKFVDALDVSGQYSFESVGSEETQEKLRELVQIAKLLGQKYEAVVTNPPYMGSSGMDAKLSDFVKKNYPDTKSDMFSTFIEKGFRLAKTEGFISMITMESWMFLSSFEKLRQSIVEFKNIVNMVHMPYLGKGGTSLGINFGTAAVVFENHKIENYMAQYDYVCYYETNEDGVPVEFPVINERYKTASLDNFSKISGSPVAYWVSEAFIDAYKEKTLSKYGTARSGLQTGDNDKFLKFWQEVEWNNIAFGMTSKQEYLHTKKKWTPQIKGGEYRKWYGNFDYVVDWNNDGEAIRKCSGCRLNAMGNDELFFKEGITWSHTTSSVFGARYLPQGHLFNVEAPTLFVADINKYYVLAFLNSCVAQLYLSAINSTMHYLVGNIMSLPLKYSMQNQMECIAKENILISKIDWDSFETSWDFQHHPLIPTQQMKSEWQESQFAESRMEKLGSLQWNYERWENECNDRFDQLKANEEELNRIFIDIYGLQDELTPEVEDKDVTVRKADLGRDIRSFISYAVGCMFGRYSLEQPGIVYAGGEWPPIDKAVGIREKNHPEADPNICSWTDAYGIYCPDEDNVIPITDEEYFPDDIVGRFVEFVKTVYGEATLEENLKFIADALGNKGDTSREVIRNYFLKDFYADHLKIYQKRPIYWLFDSGKQNGFKALIYMHRYDADTVGRVRTDYLHRAQKYVETAMQSAQYTIESTSSASDKSKATKAVAKYTKQLAEMQLYDEAIAHIANRRIEIDLDDGVKVNYAKFQGVEVAQEGKKTVKIDLLSAIK